MAAMPGRERALRIVLIVLGLGTFAAAGYPVVQAALHAPRCTAAPMLNSVLATLGVFMVLAARKPSAHRSLILFAAWSGFAHGAIMALMAIQVVTQRTELVLSALLAAAAGVLMLALLPRPAAAAPGAP